MDMANRKELILSIIHDDLINTKLVDTLNDLGMQTDHFRLYASVTIFKLMRIKTAPQRWEKIHDEYLDRTRKVLQINTEESSRLVEALAQEIYNFLKQRSAQEKAHNANRPR
jgi:hypothetical protein